MPRCAILTCQVVPFLLEEEQPLLDALKERGWQAEPVVWDRDNIDWSSFDRVIVRNTWDYHIKKEKFLATLQKIQESGCVLHNPYQTMLWNHDKSYLLELPPKGVPIVPTELISSSSPISDYFDHFSCSELVVKPTVSAGALHTYCFGRKEVSEVEEKISHHRKKNKFLIQPLYPKVREEGEWSFIYFGHTFSHAVLKTPKRGDFRVQEEHGGGTELKNPSAKDLKQANRALNGFSEDCLYARVDMVRSEEGDLRLMELELIEPQLFFGVYPAAIETLVDAFCLKDHSKPL